MANLGFKPRFYGLELIYRPCSFEENKTGWGGQRADCALCSLRQPVCRMAVVFGSTAEPWSVDGYVNGRGFALLNLDTRWPWSSPLEGEVVSSLLPHDCPPIGDAAEVGV